MRATHLILVHQVFLNLEHMAFRNSRRVQSRVISHPRFIVIFLSRDRYLAYDDIVANSQYDPATNESAELVLDARPKGRFVIL